MAELYQIRLQGRTQGPYSREKLTELHKHGKFSRAHEVCLQGQQAWFPATELVDFWPRKVESSRNRATLNTGNSSSISNEEERLSLTTTEKPEIVEAHCVSFTGAGRSQPTAKGPFFESAWYYSHNTEEYGPESLSEIRRMISQGVLDKQILLRRDGMEEWLEAAIVFENDPTVLSHSTAGEKKPLSGLALASFILGLLGTNILLLFGSILAIIFGHIAIHTISQPAAKVGGRPYALAGLVLGYMVILAAMIVGFVLLIALLLQAT